MKLVDAPIAQEGFYVTHFFTVKDQENRRISTCALQALRAVRFVSREAEFHRVHWKSANQRSRMGDSVLPYGKLVII